LSETCIFDAEGVYLKYGQVQVSSVQMSMRVPCLHTFGGLRVLQMQRKRPRERENEDNGDEGDEYEG